MESTVFITITVVCWIALFFLTSSQSFAYGQGMELKNKVDTHVHFHSPEIFNAIETITGEQGGFGWTLLQTQTPTYMQTFSIEEHLEWMDRFGIKKSVFSMPSVYLFMSNEQDQTEERKAIVEFINYYFSQLHHKYPDRAFFMADVALSIGDVEFSTNEVHRAIEDLGLHGVCVPTNIGGRQLSDPEFEPFFDEVERLGVPLYTHPESPYCLDILWAFGLFGRIGFAADENLMIAHMIYSGFTERHPNLKIVLTHLGGSLPYIFPRLDLLPVVWDTTVLSKKPSEYLKDFYYDTGIGNSGALEFLLKFLGSDEKILFGTDHPYVNSAEAGTIEYIQNSDLTKKAKEKIYFKNAERLFGIREK